MPSEFSTDVNPDERTWADEQLWQNIRHPYHSMLARGETEEMKALFIYYRRFWELNRARAKKYYGARGQHNTEMTMSFGLQSIFIYGRDRNGKPDGYADNRWGGAVYISPGLELVYLMLDYYEFTKDRKFLQKEILPYLRDLLEYNVEIPELYAVYPFYCVDGMEEIARDTFEIKIKEFGIDQPFQIGDTPDHGANILNPLQKMVCIF